MNAERKRCKQCACRMLYSTDNDGEFGCEHFNEIRGRFGGWTAEVAEEPQPFKE